jgi:hypothetical protein
MGRSHRSTRDTETKDQFKAREMKRQDPPRPKQPMARAADHQDWADRNGGDSQRETIRVGNTKASYKNAKEAQSWARQSKVVKDAVERDRKTWAKSR